MLAEKYRAFEIRDDVISEQYVPGNLIGIAEFIEACHKDSIIIIHTLEGEPFLIALSKVFLFCEDQEFLDMKYYMIVYLAGLQGVSRDLYEAASLDGANEWQKFLKITWPCVTPTTFYILMMLMVSTFKSYDIMYITTQGGPGEATKVLAYHIFNSAFVNSKFGYASAVSMVLFVIVMVVTLVQFRVEKKFTSYL